MTTPTTNPVPAAAARRTWLIAAAVQLFFGGLLIGVASVASGVHSSNPIALSIAGVMGVGLTVSGILLFGRRAS